MNKLLKGFTLTEVLVALAVLAFALIPLMGIMWSGVRKTDVSSTYSNAANVGASVLEFLLNDSVRFQDLDFSNPIANPIRDTKASRESAGLETTEVGKNDFLGDFCMETPPPGTCGDPVSKARYFKIGRDNYYTDLYIGAYYENVPGSVGRTTALSYQYMENPEINFENKLNQPHLFYDTLQLGSGLTYSLTEYSPYYHSDWKIDPLVAKPRYRTDREISAPIPNALIPFDFLTSNVSSAEYSNFAKIQIFVRWGWAGAYSTASSDWSSAPRIDERGGAKMIELVTFKGRFE